MALDQQPTRSYEFGPFRMDPIERLLRREEEVLPLTPKVFDLLLLLVQNAGRVVEKETLMKEIWPDCCVEEGNLTQQVSTLRKALGESASGRHYIQTIPRRGYRFVGDVRALSDGEGEATPTPNEAQAGTMSGSQGFDASAGRERRAGRGRSREILAAVVSLAALAAALIYFLAPGKLRVNHTAAEVKSIAVLPFKPLVAEDRDELFELGMAETLITKLSRIIAVRPISAVRRYASLEQDPIAAGREQKVDAVLEGSTQRDGKRIRVTWRLWRVRDGSVLWAGKSEEFGANIFAAQDSISEQVAGALVPTLTGEQKRLLTKRYTDNAQAYLAYTRGRGFWDQRTPGGFQKGIQHFNEAILLDPAYALAYAGIADSYSLLCDYQALPAREAYPKAKAAATRALEIDDELAEAHTSLAFVKMSYDRDWSEAERGYRRAIALNPNYPTAHQWYAEYLSGMGRHEEALAEIRRAQELDPLSPIIQSVEAWVLYYARDYDRMLARCQRVIEMHPEFGEVYAYLRRAYEQKGMYREAMNALQKRSALMGDSTLAAAAGRAAAVSDAESYWRERAVHERLQPTGDAFHLAEALAQLGKIDQALTLLEQAYEERSFWMVYLKVHPNLDPLRSDPRFTDLLRRVNLAPSVVP